MGNRIKQWISNLKEFSVQTTLSDVSAESTNHLAAQIRREDMTDSDSVRFELPKSLLGFVIANRSCCFSYSDLPEIRNKSRFQVAFNLRFRVHVKISLSAAFLKRSPVEESVVFI